MMVSAHGILIGIVLLKLNTIFAIPVTPDLETEVNAIDATPVTPSDLETDVNTIDATPVTLSDLETEVNMIIATPITPSNLETELREIRIQLCASHIDRNKLELALDQFNKTTGEGQVQELVNHYLKNYENSFNLLEFLYVLPPEVRQIGYQTFFDLCEKNKLEIFPLLKLYDSIRKSYSDVQYLNDRIETLITNTFVNVNLLELINDPDKKYIGLLSRPELEELFPSVIRRIYQNDSNRTTELLDFLSQFKNLTNQIKFTHVLLKEVLPTKNLQHLFGILHLFKKMNSEITTLYGYDVYQKDVCLIVSLEKDLPEIFTPYMSDYNKWYIKSLYNNQYLHWHTETQFNFNVLYTDKLGDRERSSWFYRGTFFDDHSIIENSHRDTLFLDRCIHNDTFVRLYTPDNYSFNSAGKALRALWTIETDDEIQFVRIKNSLTGEYLSVNEIINQDSPYGVKIHNVVLSKIADEKTKWKFEENGLNVNINRDSYFCYREN